jgi:hypothetical protein
MKHEYTMYTFLRPPSPSPLVLPHTFIGLATILFQMLTDGVMCHCIAMEYFSPLFNQ